MNLSLMFLLCVINLCFARDFYRAGVIAKNHNVDLNAYMPSIYEASKSKVDILLLPSVEESGGSNYDETVKNLAKAARETGVYVVAHLLEKSRCQNKKEEIRSNLVFDRDGNIVAVYRKAINPSANCTVQASEMTTFKTDFGTFGLLMEEDLVLREVEFLKRVKNVVVAGAWNSEIQFLAGDILSSSWAYTNKANLITHTGIYSAGPVAMEESKNILIADLQENGEGHKVPVIHPAKLSSFPGEDLSEYMTKPLDLEASIKGYKDTVCHGKFCCNFDIKTSPFGKSTEVNYGLVAFHGVRPYSGGHFVGVESCGIYSCAGLYKRSCSVEIENNRVIFERLTVSGNFSKDNSAYPKIVSTQSINTDQFIFNNNGRHVTASLKDAAVLNFGIYSRDYSKDVMSNYIANNIEGFAYYDYIFNDSVQEFFDYVWIRLRVLIFVVSIYILEQM